MNEGLLPNEGAEQSVLPTSNVCIEDDELLHQEVEYLKKIVDDIDRRREVIENKTGQIFGQASIVLSIVTLFVPLISDKLEGANFCLKLLLLLLFFATILCFLIAIWLSSNTLLINKFSFSSLNSTTVTKQDKASTKTDFLKNYIKDLVYIEGHNNKSVNEKGSTLIKAGVFFRSGLIILAVFIAVICLIVSFKNVETVKKISSVKENVETIKITKKHFLANQDSTFEQTQTSSSVHQTINK